MKEEFRFSKAPTPTIGISGHTEAKKVGNMNAALTNWLRKNEVGYQEVSFGFQSFGKKTKQNHNEQ